MNGGGTCVTRKTQNKDISHITTCKAWARRGRVWNTFVFVLFVIGHDVKDVMRAVGEGKREV